MADTFSLETMKYIVSRLAENAVSASEGDRSSPFDQGRRLAYYEMLDIIKTELEVRDLNISDFGVNFDVDSIV